MNESSAREDWSCVHPYDRVIILDEERRQKEQSYLKLKQSKTGEEESNVDCSKNVTESSVGPEKQKEDSPWPKVPHFSLWNTPTGVEPPQPEEDEEVDPFNIKQHMLVI